MAISFLRRPMFLGGAAAVVGGGTLWLNRSQEELPGNPSLSIKDEEESCRKLDLPTPAVAQRMPVVQLREFLSPEETRVLNEAVAAIQHSHRCGVIERGPDGERRVPGTWRTTYLHTDNVFRDTMVTTHDKLIDAFYQADKTGGWNLLSHRDRSKLHLRTVSRIFLL